MVDSLIPEQEPEPDIRPSSRTINEHHQQRQPDGLNSVPPPNTNFTTVQDEEKSHHNTHPLVTTQTATSSISNTDSEKHTNTTPVLTSKDYATPASAPAAATDPTTGKPLRSILSRFKNRSSAQSSPNSSEKDLGEINLVSEPDEYKSPSVGGIGTKANWSNPELSVIDAKDNNTLPTPTRSNSAAPTTRRARHPYSSDPEALHARFAPDPNPNPGYPPYLNREALRRNDSGVGIHPARGPPPGPSIRDIGPPRPPKNIGELFTPDRKLGTEPTWSESLRNTVKSSYINYLVPFIPIAWALHFAGVSDTIVFVFSFIAVIPLASLLCFATEQLALRMGDALGGLLNATFGNAVELLISILALVKGEIGLVQASMIGSILSNTLLVLGMCYFAGGLRFHEQLYAVNASQLQISLLGISTCALVLPAAYHFSTASLRNTTQVDGGQIDGLSGEELKDLLSISRGMAFMLLAVYMVYLVFVLYTHAYLFKRQRVSKRRPHEEPGQPRPGHDKVFPIPHWIDSIRSRGSSASSESGALSPVTTRDTIQPATETTLAVDVEAARMPPDVVEGESALDEDDEYEEEEKPQVKALWAFLLLLGVTAITGVTAEFLIDSIDGLASSTGVSVEFIGLILLPLVGNAVEHVAAVTVSVKDKLNLSMAIAVGSSIQVSLGILPLLVLIGWAIGQPMSLFFDTFETITLAVSLLLVNFAIVDGRSNFCEGFVLMMAYAMIALVTWFYNPPH